MLLRSLWYDLTLPTFLLGPSRLSIILNVEAVEIIIRFSHMHTDYDLVTVLMVGAVARREIINPQWRRGCSFT